MLNVRLPEKHTNKLETLKEIGYSAPMALVVSLAVQQLFQLQAENVEIVKFLCQQEREEPGSGSRRTKIRTIPAVNRMVEVIEKKAEASSKTEVVLAAISFLHETAKKERSGQHIALSQIKIQTMKKLNLEGGF